ncbi:hypothetical protein [Paraburkholderia nemoris]|uniref:hypothetical protein n=1 Tax=Paraburkholderia nemoris TaxID=2793076 RepID=UPI00190A983A|nr:MULTISPECIES: hypothetical protein [Paraburkholderia]
MSARRGVVSPTGKPVALTPVRPNEGGEATYRQRLERLTAEMQASLVYWVKACYRANEPELAQDASPAMTLRDTMNRLARRWQRRFDEAAPDLARSGRR